MIQHILEDLALKLNAGATNYSVFLRAGEITGSRASGSAALIRGYLGESAVLGGIEEVAGETVWAEVKESLCYFDDDCAGPHAATLESSDFKAALGQLEREIRRLTDGATKVERFWLSDGHPAYPVFWDFAFLIFGSAKTYILLGAASD